MREVDPIDGADIDAPWLPHGSFLRINGVDVIPLVEAELDRRFPGRAERRAADPDGCVRTGPRWSAPGRPPRARGRAAGGRCRDVGRRGVVVRADAAPLVLATDLWLGKSILGVESALHPLGLAGPYAAERGPACRSSTTEAPAYTEVLEARAERVAMVRDYLATVTPDALAVPRTQPLGARTVTRPLAPACT